MDLIEKESAAVHVLEESGLAVFADVGEARALAEAKELAGGDGVVSPGEAFDLQVVLREVAGIGFGWYPGVKFDSSHAGVTLSETDWFYGIFGCQSYDVGAQGKVDASVKPGTVVMLTARAAMLNTECPAAPALQLTLTVK